MIRDGAALKEWNVVPAKRNLLSGIAMIPAMSEAMVPTEISSEFDREEWFRMLSCHERKALILHSK
jgi:hypothetical protein